MQTVSTGKTDKHGNEIEDSGGYELAPDFDSTEPKQGPHAPKEFNNRFVLMPVHGAKTRLAGSPGLPDQ